MAKKCRPPPPPPTADRPSPRRSAAFTLQLFQFQYHRTTLTDPPLQRWGTILTAATSLTSGLPAPMTTMLIATGAFSRYGTQLAYAGVYLSSLKYVLPQCYFDHKQLAKTEAKTAPIILAKLGFNRHTHLSIRYAPSSFAGCGMIPWWVLQSEGQLALFLKNWRTDTMISKTVRIATAWSQWQSGLAESFLTDTITPLPHLEARWFQSLRYGLQ